MGQTRGTQVHHQNGVEVVEGLIMARLALALAEAALFLVAAAVAAAGRFLVQQSALGVLVVSITTLLGLLVGTPLVRVL